MKFLKDANIKNKKVLLRCDFNVPVNNGVIKDDSKIVKSMDTINYLIKNNNIVILLSHFGRVKTEEDKKTNSLYPVFEYLKKYYDIEFIPDPFNLEIIKNSDKKIFLVENTRFTDIGEKKESANDLKLALYWSSFADVFVNDAFASSHRAHTSTSGIGKYLPYYLGFLMEYEINNLSPLINNKKHPFLVIIGGAKVDDKIGIIKGLLEKCDKLIITGGILNTFLKVMNFNVGKSLVSDNEDVLKDVKEILDKYNEKIFYTKKFAINRNGEKLIVDISEINNEDIILDNYVEQDNIINESKIIFINGTCGKCEDVNYMEGTLNLMDKLTHENNVYAGGGDTASFINSHNLNKKFTYVSSGGGATLEYVAYGKLKALEWLNEK